MVLNTITVAAAVTPEVVGTSISHYIDRKPRRHKPTAHISYDLGLHLVRRFVNFSATHTVEELQAFTSQWVPAPTWVKTVDFLIPQANIDSAAAELIDQLESYGLDGIKVVGGKKWWQWRPENAPLRAEWIEMRSDYRERKAKDDKGSRVMLYVHGGAYYFGSVDEHRYQMQRHARKLKARCLAPRYRLAPQFPFPCGLLDSLAAYLYLLDSYDPSCIVVAGDSAGGGMVLSLLVVLRDRGIPLPAGGILLSPWVDLMHSFPSISGDGKLDYIPNDGFIHKPSIYWPPPTMEEEAKGMPSGVAAARTDPPASNPEEKREKNNDESRGFSAKDASDSAERAHVPTPEPGHPVPSIKLDGKLIQIRDQIQLYAPNHLLTHPLVSLVLQPSLGGLCPLLIQVGGGEMLRDEQIYIAHKAAHPSQYPPPSFILERYGGKDVITKYPPTLVQLQVWEDICHVGHTLSWTKPAKYMYRSVAQFGAWALARAQQRSIDIEDEEESESESSDDEGESSGGSGNGTTSNDELLKKKRSRRDNSARMPSFAPVSANKSIGRAGDPLPPFAEHMIRQRVDRHGNIYALPPAPDILALQLKPNEIGVLKEIPVRKWLRRQEEWNKRYAKTKRRMQERRLREKRELAKDQGLAELGIPLDEKPPPTALAGMTAQERDLDNVKKVKRSWGMSLWSQWGSKADKITLERRNTLQAEDQETKPQPTAEGEQQRRGRSDSKRSRSRSNAAARRPRSYSRTVSDQGQAGDDSKAEHKRYGDSLSPGGADVPTIEVSEEPVIPLTHTTSARPTQGGVAYPFKLAVPEGKSVNPSMITLTSEKDEDEDGKSEEKGVADPIDDSNDFPEQPDENGKDAMTGEVPHLEASDEKKVERPQPERFFTAMEGL